MFLDTRDVGVGRVVAHLVVDVDLVHHRGRELGLVVGDEQHAAAIVGGARPLDHHRNARGLESPAQYLGLDLGVLADLDQAVGIGVAVDVVRTREMGRFLGHERHAAVGAPTGSHSVLGSARRAPQRRFVHGPGVYGGASVRWRGMPADSTTGKRFHVETLGCPKNAVDSDKVVASLLADGLTPADSAADADLVVVNTCAFIEAARQESIDVALSLSDGRKPGARLVVTGCMAERYGDELAAALPEADAVVGFAGEGSLSSVVLSNVVMRGRKPAGVRDLLELPRPAPTAPWAYVKVAEGCDRACAFCAIPSFRGKQRSRTPESIEAEVRGLVEQGVAEIVLVAQDLAWYGRDAGEPGSLAPLLRRLDPLRAARSRAGAPALPLPVRGAGPARLDDARARRRSCPTSTSRCSTRRPVCCAA